uniref:Uncharacterized protein n=1 Tax=Rhizophora mucronata TaxID=61149 RepID=A0A2P2PRI4_RHIMU
MGSSSCSQILNLQSLDCKCKTFTFTLVNGSFWLCVPLAEIVD